MPEAPPLLPLPLPLPLLLLLPPPLLTGLALSGGGESTNFASGLGPEVGVRVTVTVSFSSLSAWPSTTNRDFPCCDASSSRRSYALAGEVEDDGTAGGGVVACVSTLRSVEVDESCRNREAVDESSALLVTSSAPDDAVIRGRHRCGFPSSPSVRGTDEVGEVLLLRDCPLVVAGK